MLAKGRELIKNYLKELFLELQELKLLIIIEQEALKEGYIDNFFIFTTKERELVQSISNYYKTINEWRKNLKDSEDVLNLMQEVREKKEEILNLYSSLELKIKEYIEENKSNKKVLSLMQKNIKRFENPLILDINI